MDTMVTFGEWLQQQRSLRRLTREEFAKRVGCSVSALQKIEYGTRRPSTQIAELIANCLDVPLEERSTFVRVARGELSVDRLLAETRPIATPNVLSPKANLPVFPTPLIGRERELEHLNQLLCDPQCRLLTLVGPGGIGKTRLATEAASNTQDFFANGVYFVSLAPVSATSFIVPMIGDALQFTFQSASPADPKTQLFSYLQEKQLLLLTDNLEHLLSGPGIEVLSELLASAPQVKLLATSRESLGLQGEWVFEVHGLPIPDTERVDGAVQDTSVELFLQRARRAHVEFNATSEDFPAILRICHLVDGMPLAIELAAAWVRTLTCAEIAKEIERSLDFLSISARDIPARHRSMRAVFDHSWKLLPEEEKQVLARLSVFRGGFRREAAEQVAEATLAVLSTLMTKSLIRRSDAGRYDLHELIRQFAAEHFSERLQEQTVTQARHSSYYLAYFGQADGRLRSSAQQQAIEELTIEMDNFRTAWDWAVRHKEFVLIEGTQFGYAGFFDMRGWLHEGHEHLDQVLEALEKSESGTEDAVLAHVLSNKGMLAFRMGNHEIARDSLDKSIALIRPLNQPRILVAALVFRAVVFYILGDYPNALACLDEGMQVADSIHDKWFVALYLFNYALISSAVQPIENTYEKLLKSLKLWRETGDPRFTALTLSFASLSAVAMGRFAEAQSMLEECLAITIFISDRWGEGLAYRHMGVLARKQNEYARAQELFRKSLDLFTELGAQWDVARALANLGETELAMGETSQAENLLLEAFRISVKSQGIPDALEVLVGLATIQAKRGDVQRALNWVSIPLHHPAALKETKSRAESLRAELEAQLSLSKIEAIRAHAGEKTFEAVVEELLS